MVGVFDREDVVAEARDHEQLLVERVHVADAAQVLDSDAAGAGLFVVVELDVPVALLVGAPRGALVELLHVVCHFRKVLEAVTREDQQQLVGCLPGMMAFAFGRVLAAVRNLEQAVVDQVPGELFADSLLALREALQKPGQDAEIAP